MWSICVTINHNLGVGIFSVEIYPVMTWRQGTQLTTIDRHLERNRLVRKFLYFSQKTNYSQSFSLDCTDLWLRNMDKGLLTNNVFIDLLGINSSDHATVLQKLNNYRFHGKFLNCLESYLTNRRRQCYVNGVSSDREYISCVIPQGSILGLLLFLNSVSNFHNYLQHTTPRMFVDDIYTTLTDWSTSDIELKLKSDLEAIEK